MPDCLKTDVPASLKCVPFFMNNLIGSLMVLSGITAVIFIVLAGIKFITSGGDPVKVEGAKRTMTFAIMGLVIVLLAFVILKIFTVVTGVRCNVLGVNC
jgi:hypothetical protein